MKFPTLLLLLIASLIAIGFLTSCKPLDSANPLDTPSTTVIRPPAIGYFGPHSEFYSHIP